MTEEIYNSACRVVSLLAEKSMKIATAESCTGGMVSQYITAVPGASSVFELGVASYSADAKCRIVGVSEKTVALYGTISKITACEMAQGIRKLSGAEIGVSVTGAAGPDSSEGHPPGSVFIAVADSDGVVCESLYFPGVSRERVRELSALSLLNLVEKKVNEHCSTNTKA